MSIQENIEKVNALRRRTSRHPMCAKLDETGSRVLVVYPPGAHPYLDAVRVDGSMRGKAWAFEQALDRMEKHWKEGFPS